MFGEQQKQEIRSIIAEEVKGLNESLISLKDSLETFALPFKSQFKQFLFQGTSNGTLLAKNFNDADIAGKIIIIKSVKVVPYYGIASQDIDLTDGINTFLETIPINLRANRIFDDVWESSFLELLINGGPIDAFASNFIIAGKKVNYDLGSEIDNIYYKYPEKISSLDARFTTKLMDTFAPYNTSAINVRIYLQCYIF